MNFGVLTATMAGAFHCGAPLILRPLQLLRQLGYACRDLTRLVLRHEHRRTSARLLLGVDIGDCKVVSVTDDIGDSAILLDGPGCGEAALWHESNYTPARQTLRRGISVDNLERNSRREASPNASAYDAAVLQLILNGIGHIGMRRGNSILKAAMLGRIQFERELVALIFICKAGHDDGADRPVIKGEPGHENEG